MAQEQEKISVDGTLTTLDKATLDIKTLLGDNLLYTTINTLNHKPLHLSRKIELLLEGYEALYGIHPINISTKEISKEIYNLLYFGLYPEGSNTVGLYLLPPDKGEVRRLIIHEATTPYNGYGLLSIRPTAVIAGYEIPLERYQTSLSLSASRFTNQYAVSHTNSIAIRANRAGALLSSGDNPLFVVKNHTLLTAPIEQGGRDAVERELMFRLAEMAKVKIIEEAPLVEELEEYGEIMVMTPSGIQSILSVGEIVFENIYATLLAKYLPTLTREGVAR